MVALVGALLGALLGVIMGALLFSDGSSGLVQALVTVLLGAL